MTPGFSIFSCSALTLIMIYLAGSGQGKRDSPCHLFDCVVLFVRPSKIPERSAKVMHGAEVEVFTVPCDCSLCYAFVILNYGHYKYQKGAVATCI